MTEFRTHTEAATPTNLCQAKIVAARKKRFWRACSNAFLVIHLLAVAIVGFMVGDGVLFRVVAASIVIAPVLAYLAHRPEAQEGATHG